MNRLLIILLASIPIALAAQTADWRELIDKKQFESVISEASKLQPADTLNFQTMYLLGQAYEGLMNYREAYGYYRRSLAIDSARTDMLNTLARIATNLGRVKEAEDYYLRALAADSLNFYTNFQLARLYSQTNRNREALQYYDFLLRQYPDNVSVLRNMGDCMANMDSLYRALEYYTLAYQLNPENVSIATTLINTLLILYDPMFNDNATLALQVCEDALSYNSDNVVLRQRKAMIYYVLKAYLSSDSIYSQLIAEGDSSLITLKYCGCARYYGRKWFDAIEPLERAFAKDTAAADVCLLLGISLGRTYDMQAAFNYFDKAEKLLQPDEYWTNMLWQFRAEMYCKNGDCDKCAAIYYRIKDDIPKGTPWMENCISCMTSNKQTKDMTEDEKQRLLFLMSLNVNEIYNKIEDEGMQREAWKRYIKEQLEKFSEEIFMRNLDSYPMLSPDNKRSEISKNKLKELIERIN